jgi:hypothetical protein
MGRDSFAVSNAASNPVRIAHEMFAREKHGSQPPKSKTGRTSLSDPLRYARPPVTAAILRVTKEKNQQRSQRLIRCDRLECV